MGFAENRLHHNGLLLLVDLKVFSFLNVEAWLAQELSGANEELTELTALFFEVVGADLVEPETHALVVLFFRLGLLHEFFGLLLKFLDHFVFFSAPLIALRGLVVAVSGLVLVAPIVIAFIVATTFIETIRWLCLAAVLFTFRKVVWMGVLERLQNGFWGLGQSGNYVLFLLLRSKLALTDKRNYALEQLVHLSRSFLLVLKFLEHLQEGLCLFFTSRNFFEIFFLRLFNSDWLRFLGFRL